LETRLRARSGYVNLSGVCVCVCVCVCKLRLVQRHSAAGNWGD